jgi:putative transferase (TIGR04331 family)
VLLVTTADENYWKTDEKILFLGPWCLLPGRREVWGKLDHHVLPYHWDDRSRFNADYEYAKNIAKRCLLELVPQLNGLHGFAGSYRYWNMVCGAWLRDFVGICLDRYLSIQTAADLGRIRNVLVPPLDHNRSVSAEPDIYQPHYLSPDFNNYLYGYLIQTLRPFPFETVLPSSGALAPTHPEKKPYTLKSIMAGSCEWIFRAAPRALKQVVLANTYLSKPDLCRLALRLRQLPALHAGRGVGSQTRRYDEGARAKLRLSLGEKPFEQILAKLLPLRLPQTVFEDFSSLRNKASRTFPKSARVIFSANFYGASDLLRMWAAQETSAGAKLLLHQHGGNCGTALCSANEDYEIEIGDKFYSWGWTKEGADHVHPLPSTKLSGTTRRFKPRQDGDILVGCDTAFPSFYRFASMPVGHQINWCHDDYISFLTNLGPAASAASLLRLYPRDYGWGEESLYRRALPDLRIYQGSESIYRQLNRSRLYICGSNQTTFLETLAAGFPTVIFLNPRFWEIRAEAQPFFRELCEVGIGHHSPISAAALVNDVAGDPFIWWRRSEVQAARKRFCDRFARVRDNWLSLWQEELTVSAGPQA